MKVKSTLLLSLLTLTTTTLCYAEKGDIMLRLRGIGVIPDVRSSVTGATGTIKVHNSVAPEVDASYFFTNNIAAELIAATTKHKVKFRTGGVDTDLGSVWLLPPTLTLQYHFVNSTRLKPYLGAGVNYTVFYSAKPGIYNSVSYKNRAGFALQAGMDICVKGNFGINLDVKKIFLRTSASVNHGAVKANVRLDPWIVGLGVYWKI